MHWNSSSHRAVTSAGHRDAQQWGLPLLQDPWISKASSAEPGTIPKIGLSLINLWYIIWEAEIEIFKGYTEAEIPLRDITFFLSPFKFLSLFPFSFYFFTSFGDRLLTGVTLWSCTDWESSREFIPHVMFKIFTQLNSSLKFSEAGYTLLYFGWSGDENGNVLIGFGPTKLCHVLVGISFLHGAAAARRSSAQCGGTVINGRI